MSGRVDLREALEWLGEQGAFACEMGRVERIMIGKITSVALMGEQRLEIGWDDGHVAPVDLSEAISVAQGAGAVAQEGRVRARCTQL
jgi:hypothetical protein